MHLLEDHMVPWLRRYHLAAGIMGEQGAESIHAHLNRLETTYAGIPNKLSRLKYLFQMYIVEVTAALQSLKPAIKTRRKRKRKAQDDEDDADADDA
jgi:CHASE3 domain sensor protein